MTNPAAALAPLLLQVRLDNNMEILLSDTVGFIQKLPTQVCVGGAFFSVSLILPSVADCDGLCVLLPHVCCTHSRT